MKKIVVLLMSMLVMTTSVFANVGLPKELVSYPKNFTTKCQVTISVDDNKDIRNLIEELATEYGVVNAIMGVDVFSLLTAMFEYNSTIDIKADISEDNAKMKLSVTNKDVFSSVVSSNLNYTINSKSGIWADIDLTNVEEPKFDIIFLSPTMDKYRYVSAGKYLPKENLPLIKTYISPNVIQKVLDKNAQLIEENSTIEKFGDKYKITVNNDNLVALIDAISKYNPFDNVVLEEAEVSGEETEEINIEDIEDVDLAYEDSTNWKDIKILGKDGIEGYYYIKNGQLSRTELKADISLNISQIAQAMGADWEFESQGIVNIKLSEVEEFSRIGTTDVKFPELNENNSFFLNDIIDENIRQEEEYESYEEYAQYPLGYVSMSTDTLPIERDNYYIPLRGILENGYEDSVDIAYEDGIVTATSEFFTKFETLTIDIRGNKVYTDGVEQACGDIKLIDDATYVDSRLFTDVFGWYLSGIEHDILGGLYNISFWSED